MKETGELKPGVRKHNSEPNPSPQTLLCLVRPRRLRLRLCLLCNWVLPWRAACCMSLMSPAKLLLKIVWNQMAIDWSAAKVLPQTLKQT